MSSFSVAFGFFVTWCWVQSGEGQCPEPPTIPNATYFAAWYVVGTKVEYKCEDGFARRAGISNKITCANRSGLIQWTCRQPPACLARSELIRIPPEQSPTKNCEGNSSHSQPTAQPVMNGVCRFPRPLSHATAQVVTYSVGQNLIYECLAGDGRQDVTTCEDAGAKKTWSYLTLQCTNGAVLRSPVWVMILLISGVIILKITLGNHDETRLASSK